MKTLYLTGDISEFVKEIAAETEKGNSVIINIAGFNAIVFGGNSITSVRSIVQSKLRAISDYCSNVQKLEGTMPAGVLSKFLANATPDEVAELCFEQGLVGGEYPSSRHI